MKCLSYEHSAPSNSHRIVLNFTFMDTECTYDYLFVYDGDSYQSPLLASLSGKTLPQPIEAKSGKVGRIVMFLKKYLCMYIYIYIHKQHLKKII